MADKPIDTSDRPSMVSVRCGGPDCGEWIVVDRAFTGTGYCSDCLLTNLDASGPVTAVTPPDHWYTRHNPPPPPADYPPTAGAAIRAANPDVAAACTSHGGTYPVPVPLLSLNPDDITIAFAAHDQVAHRDWLIGGPGGANGDVCNPCAGAVYDRAQGKTVVMEGGPRHDMCLNGRTRGRGGDCGCTHNKPWMRGTKPRNRDTPGAVERTRAILDRHRPPTAEEFKTPPAPEHPKPLIITGYLFDPEEETP